MIVNQPNSDTQLLSPERIAQKAATLETNLQKMISRQPNPADLTLTIDREKYPDTVIFKVITQLMPRYNVQPRLFLLALRDLLAKQFEPDQSESIEKNLDVESTEQFDDSTSLTRIFIATATLEKLIIQIQGVEAVPSFNGTIAKSYFDHELSAGKVLKGGGIDFKEINKFPIVNAGDNLFYIQHEQQGSEGLSFEGKTLTVEQAGPYPINIGEGVERIDDIDSAGQSKGYYLRSRKTGAVLLERNQKGKVSGIDIQDEIKVEKLDYSTGNIGTQYTCPVSMKVGEICSGFKIRVNGKVEADIIDGGEIITNNEAVVFKAQSGSSILALKNITATAITHSKLISEKGCITIQNEMIDSEISGPKIIFEKTKGLVTNSRIETADLMLKGCYFSAVNIIYFGNTLFVEEKEKTKKLEETRAIKLEHQSKEKLLMGQLQLDLKRMTKLVNMTPDLIEFIRPLILATKTMDYQIIFSNLEKIEQRNNTKVVSNVRKIFKTLEKIPPAIKECQEKQVRLQNAIKGIREKMTQMNLKIEGTVRRAGTIKIFCGIHDEKEKVEPDFIIESDDAEDKYVNVKGVFSQQNGFEFIH